MIKATDRKLVVGLEIGTAKVAALVGKFCPTVWSISLAWAAARRVVWIKAG
ncbi:hypothetical protein K7G95_24755 [Escherichia coli]|nr:hypothetical protein K7G95_24755 [Escherichia coli]STF00160.1 cell division protein FtsA [Escherichia coli]